MRKTVSGIMLILLLASILSLAFFIRPVKASGTVYIRADGSVEPSITPISTVDNITYTFTGDIYDEVVVQRDNIVVDGAEHTVSLGWVFSGSKGIHLQQVGNVTLKNTIISGFYYGIYLNKTKKNTVSGNIITNNIQFGIIIEFSSNNTVSGNSVTANWAGVVLQYSSNNTVAGNMILNNVYGFGLYLCSGNKFYHNSFIDNMPTESFTYYESSTFWDDGYPSGGNYWNNYAGTDLYKGPYQNKTGSDGIGDTPYAIQGTIPIEQDRYPLMYPRLARGTVLANAASSKTVVGQGLPMGVDVTTENMIPATQTFNVTAKVFNATHAILLTPDYLSVTSPPRNSTTVAFRLNATGFTKGNYTYTTSIDIWQSGGEPLTYKLTCWVIVATAGDITGTDGWPDGTCNMMDVGNVAILFGVNYPDPRYNPNFDIDCDMQINMVDLGTVARHFGETDP